MIDTYPDFRIDLDRVRAAITPRTKTILFNSPANPTGVVATTGRIRGLARLAAERNVLLVSDEIYSLFSYDAPFVSPADVQSADAGDRRLFQDLWHDRLAGGLSRTGRKAIIAQMIKLQQYTFVCARSRFNGPPPRPWTSTCSRTSTHYRRKRDWLLAELARRLRDRPPGGAFYIFPARLGHGERIRGPGDRERAA